MQLVAFPIKRNENVPWKPNRSRVCRKTQVVWESGIYKRGKTVSGGWRGGIRGWGRDTTTKVCAHLGGTDATGKTSPGWMLTPPLHLLSLDICKSLEANWPIQSVSCGRKGAYMERLLEQLKKYKWGNLLCEAFKDLCALYNLMPFLVFQLIMKPIIVITISIPLGQLGLWKLL